MDKAIREDKKNNLKKYINKSNFPSDFIIDNNLFKFLLTNNKYETDYDSFKKYAYKFF